MCRAAVPTSADSVVTWAPTRTMASTRLVRSAASSRAAVCVAPTGDATSGSTSGTPASRSARPAMTACLVLPSGQLESVLNCQSTSGANTRCCAGTSPCLKAWPNANGTPRPAEAARTLNEVIVLPTGVAATGACVREAAPATPSPDVVAEGLAPVEFDMPPQPTTAVAARAAPPCIQARRCGEAGMLAAAKWVVIGGFMRPLREIAGSRTSTFCSWKRLDQFRIIVSNVT